MTTWMSSESNSSRQSGGGAAEELVADVEGHVPRQRAGLLERGQQHPGLLAGPGAELDERVGLGQLGDRRGVRLEQGALGPGRVVLGELGDLLEEAAAPLVVEPHRGDGLLLALQPLQRVGQHLAAHLLGREMDVDRVRHGSGVPGQPQPAEGPARAGREEVAVGGTDVPGRRGAAPAAQHVLAHHELAVVLADGARSGPEPRVGRVGARGPLPGVAEDAVGRDRRPWVGRAGRRAGRRARKLSPSPWVEAIVSHSDSVGSRMPVQCANASAS